MARTMSPEGETFGLSLLAVWIRRAILPVIPAGSGSEGSPEPAHAPRPPNPAKHRVRDEFEAGRGSVVRRSHRLRARLPDVQLRGSSRLCRQLRRLPPQLVL